LSFGATLRPIELIHAEENIAKKMYEEEELQFGHCQLPPPIRVEGAFVELSQRSCR